MDKLQLDQLTDEQISFQLILHSGNARSKVIQSLRELAHFIKHLIPSSFTAIQILLKHCILFCFYL